MTYVLHYDIAATLLLLILLAFFLVQKHLDDIQSRLFFIDLLVALLVAATDIWSCYMIGRPPLWMGWLSNMLCLLSGHALPPLMLFYFLIVVGCLHGLSKLAKVLLLIPFAIDATLIISSLFTRSVFYIDDGFQYIHGEQYYVLYVIGIFYVLASLFVVIYYRKRLRPLQFYAALSFMVLQILAALLQILLPGYLLICLAACSSLIMMYFTIQAPGDYIDSLTQCYNRNALDRKCGQCYSTGQPFVLLAFAPDNFEQVNTVYGSVVGDDLLRCIAATVQSAWPWSTVARDMGDRFYVMVPGTAPLAAEKQRMLDKFPTLWHVDGFEIQLTACSVALDSRDFSSSADILATADYTIRNSKRIGPASTVVVDANVRAELSQSVELETVVERAVRDGQILVWFQPIMDMRTGRIHSAEALSRIYDEKLGWIPPDQFIPITERSGSVIRLSEIMRERVCRFITEYDLEAAGIHHISTNLSVIECMESAMAPRILETMRRFGIRPGAISFEITESTAALSMDVLRHNMNELISDGYDFHLDDYGSGYSNIVNLLELPFSTVKIDKFILQSAFGSKENLVGGLISPFRDTGISVVCEGIETPRQEELVKKWFVEYGQGFLYSKPLPPQEFVRFANLKKRCGD